MAMECLLAPLPHLSKHSANRSLSEVRSVGCSTAIMEFLLTTGAIVKRHVYVGLWFGQYPNWSRYIATQPRALEAA